MLKQQSQSRLKMLVREADGKWVTPNEPSAEWSATWPTSGMTAGGHVYELPTSEHPTAESDGSLLPTPADLGHEWPRPTRDGLSGSADGSGESLDLLPTPNAYIGGGSQHPDKIRAGGHMVGLEDVAEHVLLPTPAVNDMGRSYTVEEWDAWTARMKREHKNGNGHDKSLEIEAARLLPTPSVADTQGGRKSRSGNRSGELLLNGLANEQRFGQYAHAIARWEKVLGREAPSPTEPTGRNGAHRLSPRFVEWMMGLPTGHVTDVPNLSRNDQLKALGNGVVIQQAYEGLRRLFIEGM